MSDKEWKERGIGELKLLKDRETGKIRLLMRRERVLKLCCNHYLTSNTKFLEMDNRSYIWSATDFSDEKSVDEKFAIRFKSADVARSFLEAVKQALNQTLAKSSPISNIVEQDKQATEAVHSDNAESKQTNALQSFSFKMGDTHNNSNIGGVVSESGASSQGKKPVFGSHSVFSFNNKITSSSVAGTGKFVFGQPQPSIFGSTTALPDSKPLCLTKNDGDGACDSGKLFIKKLIYALTWFTTVLESRCILK